MAAIGVLSIVAGVLGIVSYGMDQFDDSGDGGTKITFGIAVSSDSKGYATNTAGDLPDVRLWSEAGDYLGMTADPGYVDDGAVGTVSVDVDTQSTYALMSANDDAICIATAGITWQSGYKWAWSGNWGRQCGATWYWSNYFKTGSNNDKGTCTWIDGDSDKPTGFQVHWPDFARGPGHEHQARLHDVDYYCSGVPFGVRHGDDPSVIHYFTHNKKSRRELLRNPHEERSVGISASPNSTKPDRPKRGPIKFTTLVEHDHPEQPASDLCGSETSWGPDYVNHAEGKFCSMEEKKLYDVCSGSQKDNCFDAESHQLIVNGANAFVNSYTNVLDWRVGSQQ